MQLAVTATFNPTSGLLSVFGDSTNNTISVGRNAAGAISVNGGAVAVSGGSPTITNVIDISVFAQGGNDTVTLSETIGPLPRASLFGGNGNDVLTGGSGTDALFGQGGLDTLFGRGNSDLLFGGDDDDVLTGGDGNDSVYGDNGSDQLIHNLGDDTDINEGGADADTVIVVGGSDIDAFALYANAARALLERFNTNPFALDIGTVETINLQMLGGADFFSLAELGTTPVTAVLVDLAATAGGTVGDGAADTLNINGALSANGAVTVRNSDSLDVINVNTDGVGQAYAVFDKTTIAGSLSIGTGGLARIGANGAHVLTFATLSLAGTGTLDLANNSLIVDHPTSTPSPADSVRTWLQSGYANGAWNGPGIVSTNAVLDTRTGVGWARSTELFTTLPATWKGQSVDASAVLLTHTLKADATLDRSVNFDDLLRVARRYNLSGDWGNGDFNYDTLVNFDDLLALAQTYNVSIVVAAPTPARATRRLSADVLE